MKKIFLLFIFIVFLVNCNTNRDSLISFEKKISNLNEATSFKVFRTKEKVNKNDIFIYELTSMKENILTKSTITFLKSMDKTIRSQGTFTSWNKSEKTEDTINFLFDGKKEVLNKNVDPNLDRIFRSQQKIFTDSPWRFYLKDEHVNNFRQYTLHTKGDYQWEKYEGNLTIRNGYSGIELPENYLNFQIWIRADANAWMEIYSNKENEIGCIVEGNIKVDNANIPVPETKQDIIDFISKIYSDSLIAKLDLFPAP